MILGIDHVAIAVHDPDAAIVELAATLGIPPGTSGGRHAAWGTRNRLLWLGDTYIELVTVVDARLAERSWLGRPILLALPSGPAAISWAISSDDLDLDRSEMNQAGASLGASVAGERRRPDGRVVRWRLSLPPDVDLQRPFLIEHDTTAAEWTPDDRAERHASPARLLALELPVDAVDGVPGAHLGTVLGDQEVHATGAESRVPALRIGGLARGAADVTVLGCRWLIE